MLACVAIVVVIMSGGRGWWSWVVMVGVELARWPREQRKGELISGVYILCAYSPAHDCSV